MVEVKQLSHSFGSRKVLEDITFSVAKGEIVAVMGSSGGGKTTLLKCISGLLRPTKGSVTIEDVDVVAQPEEARRHVGLVFQYAALFDYMNVFENILFGVKRRRKIASKDEAEFVRQRLEEVGLTGCEELMPSELSGGMRKRVGLARALALEPSLLLYDEPTSGLDPVTAYSIDQLIVDTRGRTGTTSLVVSHDVTSVFRTADRIAFLEKGRLLFLGTRSEFKEMSGGPIGELVEKARAETLRTV
ncbi:MAG TPA: ATP-binding cassette domain-containing protein [Fimbriimonadaceae bacterium]|nr:ATP-binding cassette domain-containing protein [Fimbriimonadaceae bacterium]